MGERRRYRKKETSFVTAVRLDLDTDGFRYRKWGDIQRCKRGDWLVNNAGEVYSVDADVFARTYSELSPGVYHKTAPVWAEVAGSSGSIQTREGRSHYAAGDYIVFNEEGDGNGYCMSREKFESMYEPAP
jgi:hypothetical protein